MVKITGLEAFVNLVGKENLIQQSDGFGLATGNPEEDDCSENEEEEFVNDAGLESGEVKPSPNYEPDQELDFA